MASGNMKEIKNRIKSVGSTMQITKAMELVASSKLRKAKELSEKTAPYFAELHKTMSQIASNNKEFSSIFTKKSDENKPLYIVIAGERGLAGGYNSNMFKLVKSNTSNVEPKFITIGKKASEYITKNFDKPVAIFDELAHEISLTSSEELSKIITGMYEKKQIDSVYMCYTELESPLVQTPKIIKLLPLNNDDFSSESLVLTEYEGGAEAVFNAIVPGYISGIVYGGVTSSYASEQAARRIAMESASDNATDMIDSLSLIYNRARQDAITQELTEIVAGSKS